MTFDDLKFAAAGCCVSHQQATATHENGFRTDVTDAGDGQYQVVTFFGSTLWLAQQTLDRDGVNARLKSDARLQA